MIDKIVQYSTSFTKRLMKTMNDDSQKNSENAEALKKDQPADDTLDSENATATQTEDTPDDLDKNATLMQAMDKLQEELTQTKDRYLRTVADMENLRKRTARDKEEIRRTATASLVEDLLPALDSMQMGLNTADSHPEAKEVARGFEMVNTQFEQILQKHGLEAINPEIGADFDPNIHESVALQPNEDIPEDHVMGLMRIGYKLNERLLRPASVIVSSGKAKEE